MTDVLAALDTSTPAEFWQTAISAVPELENVVNAALANHVNYVIHNGILRIYTASFVGIVPVPKSVTLAGIVMSSLYIPSLPPEGQLTVNLDTQTLEFILYDDHHQFLYDFKAALQHRHIVGIPPGSYHGKWIRRNLKPK